jgi:hypothetical protein
MHMSKFILMAKIQSINNLYGDMFNDKHFQSHKFAK